LERAVSVAKADANTIRPVVRLASNNEVDYSVTVQVGESHATHNLEPGL